MKNLVLLFVLTFELFANTQPYKKSISFDSIEKPTLVRVKLDKELYRHTKNNYKSVRLKNSQGEEGYFIESEQAKSVMSSQTLKASSYERSKARLNYEFEEPFEVEELQLNIEDRIESFIDVYVDGVLISSKNKIFDYSKETGIRDFSIKIKKQKVKKISLVYHMDTTTAFYKKYKNIRKQREYLSIKSVLFLNHNKEEKVFEKHYVKLLSLGTKEKVSSYIFQVNNIPSDKLEFLVLDKNFKRELKVYASDDLEEFLYSKNFSVYASSIEGTSNLSVNFQNRAKYIKVEVENKDNKPLIIEGINILLKSNYLYFIADPNEVYELYFGDENLEKHNYELVSVISNKEIYMTGS